MIDLTEWQVNFIRKAIGNTKMCRPVRGYANNDDIELVNFEDDLDKAYPDTAVDE